MGIVYQRVSNGAELLTDKFIEGYPAFPEHMSNLGQFVYYRTYSRFLHEQRRRETWKETVRRSVEYNFQLVVKHFKKIGVKVSRAKIRAEAENFFDNMFNLRQFLSGRTMWVGGSENGVAEKYPLANFNCSFLNIRQQMDFGELFYALLVGTGVGFKSTPEFARGMAPIRTNTTLKHADYQPVPKGFRLEKSKLIETGKGFAEIHVGDSKEGWCQALDIYFSILTESEYEHIHTVTIFYNSIRPKGERLMTFGGTASGHEPLKDMFTGIDEVLKNKIDTDLAPIAVDEFGYGQLRPIHVLDIGNLIGANVVVGGVRRTAELFLFSAQDIECLFAKYGINGLWKEESFEQHDKIRGLLESMGLPVPAFWERLGVKKYAVLRDKEDPKAFLTKEDADAFAELTGGFVHYPYNEGRKLDHRRMSNNSIGFTEQPDRAFLDMVFEMLQMEGEPGFVNLEEGARRRLAGQGIHYPDQELLDWVMMTLGLNPCAEILLDGHEGGGVCNLTTVNWMAFVKPDATRISGYSLDVLALIQAQRLSARAGIRMTLVDIELDRWKEKQHRDRLIGTSLTGVKDAIALCGYDEHAEERILTWLANAVKDEAEEYCKELRIATPLLDTTIKPEGTQSQVASSTVLRSPVSSGLHWSHAPYFIRRVRINADDPLVQAVKELGWTVNPEVDTKGETYEEKMKNARTLVIDFPVASGANKTKDDVKVREQFDTYFRMQRVYTRHNSSNTIHVRPDEWKEAEDIVWDNWNDFTAVSFLSYSNHTYQLAPYETITKEQYETMIGGMRPFDPTVLQKYETTGESELDESGCETGACPIR